MDADEKPRRRPRGRPDTREAILSCAQALLQQRGFNGFSYQHIAAELGLRTAAIHYHFPAKDDLGVALVRRYRDNFQNWMHDQHFSGTGWARLQGYFGTYLSYLEIGEGRLCPGGVFGSDFGVLSDEMRTEARMLMRETYGWLMLTLEEGRSEEHTSELQSLMRISYAVFCLKKKKTTYYNTKKHMDYSITKWKYIYTASNH